MTRPVRITRKQKAIMGTILRLAGEGQFKCVKDLHAEIPHSDECSYGALRLSLNRLEDGGLIVREPVPGSHQKLVKPTSRGYEWFRPLRE